jgi:hypothetical protein
MLRQETTRGRIIALLDGKPDVEWTLVQISEALGIPYSSAQQALYHLHDSDRIERLRHGVYRGRYPASYTPQPWLVEPHFIVPPPCHDVDAIDDVTGSDQCNAHAARTPAASDGRTDA